MTCDDKCGMVCNRHVESLLLWPKPQTVAHLQEFQFSLNPPKPGSDKTEDASHYRCAMNREPRQAPVRFRQEKTVVPFHVVEKPTERFRSTLHVNLIRRGEALEIDNQNYKRELEVNNGH